MIQAARAYAQRLAWPVFPLAPRSKVPLISRAEGGRGYLDATTDLAQVDFWWSQCPAANIGLACCEASGLLALDIDPRDDGDHTLAELEAQHGTLPETVVQLTGRGDGGQHFLFRHPGGALAGDLGPGLEVKAAGYVVAAPSVHPDSGEPYRWDVGAHPLETELAELPPWALELARRRERRTDRSAAAEGLGEIEPTSFRLGAAFEAAGLLGPEIKPGCWAVVCPNEAEHTTGKPFNGSSVIFAPRRANGERRGVFICKHAHCDGRHS